MKRLGGLLVLVAAVAALLLWALHDDDPAHERRAGGVRGPGPAGARSAQPRDDAQAAPPAGAQPGDVPAAAPAIEGGLRVVGIAVDATRHPVPGCLARIEQDGHEVSRALTGGDGAFVVYAQRRAGSMRVPTLLLDAGGGRGAAQWVWLPSAAADEVDVGRIELKGIHALDVRVVLRGNPVPGARVALATPERLAVADEQGRVRFECVPPGNQTVLAHVDGSGRGKVDIEVPHDGPVTVALPEERIVTVTVVDKATGRPVEGARIDPYETVRSPGTVFLRTWLPPMEVAPTDGQGRTRLRGLDAEAEFNLRAAAPGYPRGHVRGWDARVRAGETEARIELSAARTARWPVVAGESPVPPDGAAIAVEPRVGTGLDGDALGGATARMEGATLVVDGLPAGHATFVAVAPDGSRATPYVPENEDVGHEIAFRPARTVDVIVHVRGGGPVEGVFVNLRNQGNNPRGDPVASDAEGRVRFEGLEGGQWDVYAGEDSTWWSGERVATVDLEKGSASVEVALEPLATWRIHVTVDGEPRLPAGLTLLVNGRAVTADSEEPDTGLLTVTRRPPGAGYEPLFAIGAPGYPTVSAKPDESGDVALDLRTGGRWTVEVLPPGDGRHSVQLQRRADDGSWTYPRSGGVLSLEPTGNHLEFDRLEPGTYRLFDTLSACTSEERSIALGDVVESRFDLRGVGIVRGRVVVPEGAEVRSARIDRTEVGETPGTPRGIVYAGAPRVNADGTWEARVPGDRPVLLHFRHPSLVAAEGASPLRVTQPPPEEPVIEFVAGAEALLTLPGPRTSYPVQVLLYRGDVAGEPVARLSESFGEDGDRYRFRGIVPGTWTLWIDAQGYVPLVLRDVELPEGTSDLGAPVFSRGTTLRVHLELPEGRDAPRVFVSAECRDEPRYWRSLNSGGGTELSLPGLGAGTFEVRCRPIMGGVTPAEIPTRTITVDGKNDLELVFEME